MNQNNKITIKHIQEKKNKKIPITMLTAYDYPSAVLVDQAGIDIILVGDSLAMTVLGYSSTLPVTVDEMLHHSKMVARGAKRSFLIADMPFLSYQTGSSDAIRNAGRFLKEGRMDAVKLEGGKAVTEIVKSIIDMGIPVMGHIGLTPQSVRKIGGYYVQGKTALQAESLYKDAQALEEAGCFAIVLEAIPAPVAKKVSREISIPTIGIGAGPDCDGQVLVFHDLLGMLDSSVPKFVKQYAKLHKTIISALQNYRLEVEKGKFPLPKHCYKMDEEELKKFLS
jgi:3-methyl-2-oxobutanoate hydroxymethyltransferase